MDTSTSITAPDSVFFRGQWHAATWLAEVVDESTGELIITATLAGAEREPVVTALRMTMELARELRAAAGFEGARPGVEERLDELERKHDAFYATVQTAFALAQTGQRAITEAEMREVAKDEARDAAGGCYDELGEHWEKLKRLATDLTMQERKLDTLSGVAQQSQAAIAGLRNQLALVADDDTAIGRVAARAESMESYYDAERDAAPVSRWDMILLDMIQIINARLVALAEGVGGGR